MRLSFKISLVIVLTLGLLGGAAGYATVQYNSRAARSHYEDVVERLSSLVLGQIESEMTDGSWRKSQQAMEDVAAAPDISAARIVTRTGMVFASGDPADNGKQLDDPEIRSAIKNNIMVRREREGNGELHLSVIRPLPNDAECRACHGPSLRVLGALEVALDASALQQDLRRQVLIVAGAGLGTMLAAAVSLTLALRRMVLDRLRRLAAAARSISAGDRSSRIQEKSADEIGVVTRAFNDMAQAVDDSTRRLEDTVRQRTTELAGLVQVIATINRFLDAEHILADSLKTVAEVSGADAACIVLRGPGGYGLTLRSHYGLTGDEVQDLEQGRAARTPEGLVFTRFAARAVAPLTFQGQPSGWLAALRRGPQSFSHEAAQFLMAVAEPLGVAIEKSRLYQQLQERDQMRGELLKKLVSAQEEERKRIAREIHDEWGQKLSAIIFSIAQAEAGLPPDSTALAEKLGFAKELARQALHDMRQLISELRPEMLDDLGLVPTLRNYFRKRLEPLGLSARLEHSGMDDRLPPQVELQLFRVLQEALSNVARHSGASAATVRLENCDHIVHVLVHDDGKGFDVHQVRQNGGGWGIKGIGERVSQLGGTLNVKSAPGKGTSLSIDIPLETGGGNG